MVIRVLVAWVVDLGNSGIVETDLHRGAQSEFDLGINFTAPALTRTSLRCPDIPKMTNRG